MKHLDAALEQLARQDQFLEVVDRDEATARFHRHLKLQPLGLEAVPLSRSLGRVLATDVIADVDVPGFDRASVDGFAVRAADTLGASEASPKILQLTPEILTPGHESHLSVAPGMATLIATGGMVPRGADSIVMVEHTDTVKRDGSVCIEIRRPAAAGQFIAYAGSDLARGEAVLSTGRMLTSREIGMLAAIGRTTVDVYRRPRVAIISTGDEIIAPGQPIRPGRVYDSNSAILSAAVEEAGGSVKPLGIGSDDEMVLSRLVDQGLRDSDMVIMSGGTSKGAGDLCYRAIALFKDPGVLVHGVALKPGKPICLAVTKGKPVIILPGFPTSAIFTFHAFVAPVIRAFAGLPPEQTDVVQATLPLRVSSERGRTEFVMVSLVRGHDSDALVAYPIAKGSGAVTSFSHADGFITIERNLESVSAGETVKVQLIGGPPRLADLAIIGSHCVGLDAIARRLRSEGLRLKLLNVGSTGGLAAAKRNECDVAGIHLMDAGSGEYNHPFISPDLEIVPGYRRMQGILFRKGDPRFEGQTIKSAIELALNDGDCIMVSRNAGSGTRILIDRILNGTKPPGYWMQPKSHNAVAVAIAQNRADWGVAIETVARQYELGFIPLQDEFYDFVIPRARRQRSAVQRFCAILQDQSMREELTAFGFRI